MKKPVSNGKICFALCYLLFLLAIIFWVRFQEMNYDPEERDISFDSFNSVDESVNLYKTPLKSWHEPSSVTESSTKTSLGIFSDIILPETWQIQGRIHEFTSTTLFEKINGAAEQFLSYGFKKLYFSDLISPNGQNQLVIELYDMDLFANAFGLFIAQKNSQIQVKSSAATYFYTTDFGVVGCYNRYYFKITGDMRTPGNVKKAAELMKRLIKLPITSTKPPLGFSLFFEKLSHSLSSISYQKINVFQLDFTKDFWFVSLGTGNDPSLFLHEAENESAAKDLFYRIALEQGHEYKILENEDRQILMQHNILKSYFYLNRWERFLFGCVDARKPDSAKDKSNLLFMSLKYEEQDKSISK